MPSLVSRNSAVSNYLLCWSFSGLSPPDTLFTMFSVSSPCTGTCVSRKQPIILEKSGAICSQETIREKALRLCWLFYRMITETVYRRHLCPGVWQSCFVISRSVTNLVPFWRLVILANSLSSIGTWICYVEKYIVEDTYLMLAHRKWHTLCKASTVWLSSSRPTAGPHACCSNVPHVAATKTDERHGSRSSEGTLYSQLYSPCL